MTDARTPDDSRSVTEVLIELGRDREAVAAATRDLRQPGGPMDGVEQLDELIPTLQALVRGVTADQLDRPTACADFTVAGVLEHMIGGATAFAPAFRGEAAPSEPDATAATNGVLQEHFQRAMADLLDAVHAPGAQTRTVSSPFGEVAGSVFARYVAFDGLVHGWDIATATGQRYAPPVDVVVEVDAFVRGLLQPAMRDGTTFAMETEPPPDADPLEKVIAFSGRRVSRKDATA